MWSAEFIRALARAAGGPTIKLFLRIMGRSYNTMRRSKVKIYVANFQCTKCKARFYSVVYIGGKDRPTAYESQCPDCRKWNATTDLTEVTDDRQINQLISTISGERRTDCGC